MNLRAYADLRGVRILRAREAGTHASVASETAGIAEGLVAAADLTSVRPFARAVVPRISSPIKVCDGLSETDCVR